MSGSTPPSFTPLQQLNFPETKSWLTKWEWNSLSTGTEFGLTLGNIDFVIAAMTNGYGQTGNMSVKK